MKLLKWSVVAILFAAVMGAFPTNASAVTAQGIGLEPVVEKANPSVKEKAFFVYNLAPGTKHTGAFKVTNHSATSKTLDLFAVDATTTADGTFAMLNRLKDENDIGSWVSLSASRIMLSPGSSKVIAIAITVPKHASVGDHIGGIIAQDVAATNQVMSDDTKGVKIISRVGLRIYGTVTGQAKPNVKIVSIKAQRFGTELKTTTSVKNDGNTIVTPSGFILYKPLLGKQVMEQLPAGIILAPGATYTFANDIKTNPILAQWYAVTASIQYDQNTTFAKTGVYSISNARLAMVGILLAVVALAYSMYRRFKKLYVRRSV